jgi:hypothetical protein
LDEGSSASRRNFVLKLKKMDHKGKRMSKHSTINAATVEKLVRRCGTRVVENRHNGHQSGRLSELVGEADYRAILLAHLAPHGLDDAPVTDEAMILLASGDLEANEAIIAEKLGLCSEFVSVVGRRLRASGIWVGDCVAHIDRWDQCLMIFMLDVFVATGQLNCEHESGTPQYHPLERDVLLMLLATMRPEHVRCRTLSEVQVDLERHGVCLDSATAQRWLREAYDAYTDVLKIPGFC